jgi:hypothetical protein
MLEPASDMAIDMGLFSKRVISGSAEECSKRRRGPAAPDEATSTYNERAIQICVFTAFLLVP